MKFALTILGSNSAIPSRDRYPTAQVLQVDERPYLIDCGEGTQMRFHLHKIRHQKIDHVFISHLHGDHYFGLIGLISTYNLTGRINPFHVFGPLELEEIIHIQLKASATVLRFPLVFHPIQADQEGMIHEDDRIEVFTFPLEHRIPTHGFLFQEKSRLRGILRERLHDIELPFSSYDALKKGEDLTMPDGKIIPNQSVTKDAPAVRSYAYMTDTRPQPHLTTLLKGVDLLYHEATFLQDKAALSHDMFHSTAAEAAVFARDAQVGKLIIGHFSTRYPDLEAFLLEASTIFPSTSLAIEGSTFQVHVKRGTGER